MDIQTPDVTRKIQTLNDLLRRNFVGGLVMMTRTVSALHDDEKEELVRAVQRFNDFNEDNDPHEEHDFGIVKVRGSTFYWKIDYYDRSMEMGSPDPSDPRLTKRVITLMHQADY